MVEMMGLMLLRKIYKAKEILKANGFLALEIGNGQFREVSAFIKNLFRRNILQKTIKIMSGV